MLYRFNTKEYLFEKKEYSAKVSNVLYANCYSFIITARNTQKQIRKVAYLLEHTFEATYINCVDKNCSSLAELLKIPASDYFHYLNFIGENSFHEPRYDLIISAEKNDFLSIFEQDIETRKFR